MRPSILFLLCLFIVLIFPINSLAQGFKTYLQEVWYLKIMLDCPKEKIVPSMNGFGALYICTMGDKETVKLYVSEDPGSDKVQNIGMLWSERKADTTDADRSDLEKVEEALDFLIDMYVPARRNEIKQAFWDSKNESLKTSDFLIYLTHKTGPQEDERLILIEEQ